MKYLLIILITFITNGCLGQYPKAAINKEGEIYNANAYTQTQFDSVKYYWSKQVYWEGKMNGELERLNKKGHSKDISKNLLRYQDSAIKYQLLLYKIRKQK